MAAISRPQRVSIPDELSGDFTGVIIGTFGASLEFAEAHLFGQFAKSTVNRIILADERQLSGFLAEKPNLRRLNRAYVASSVHSPHAHHPKYILLAGPDKGRLFVGSGNLSMSGYAGPGECFTVHEWDRDDPEADAAPFGAVRELIDGVIANGWLDRVVADRVTDIFAAARWIPTGGGQGCSVVHNLQRPMLDQLIERIGEADVRQVVAAAPFHDKSAYAIRELLRALSPQSFQLLVQARRTRLDVGALAQALENCPHSEILEASAPAPYPNTLLHAKFILVRTSNFDILLQGSANLSRVALCEAGLDANVELSNLLTGAPGDFDHLLEGLDLQTRVDGLTSFDPDEDWGDSNDFAAPSRGPSNVCWAPPTLSGFLPESLQPTIDIRASGSVLDPTESVWQTDDDGHHFSLRFSDAEIDLINHSRTLEVIDSNQGVWTIYPYHLHSLLRLSANGTRAALLQETGDLDLRDKELEELVSELDRVLIVDGRSLWRLARPDSPDEETGQSDETPSLDYSELDWDRIGRLPKVSQYASAANRTMLAPTELGIVLNSLTSRFRAEVRAGAGETGDDSTGDGDDLGVEPEKEDPDEVDDGEEGQHDEETEDDGGRTVTHKTRVRQLWRSFVRRFIAGLSDAEFIQMVGSAVVMPSYVVFNHLCRRLRVIDLVDADFLTEAQIALWSFMWGDTNRPGYLASLSDEEREVARRILADHDDLPVTLAAIDDAWWHAWEAELDPISLRDTWRGFLDASDWQPAPQVFEHAALVAMRCDGEVDQLFDDLFELANYFEPSELRREVSRKLSISGSQLQLAEGTVMRNGNPYDCKYFRADNALLTPQLAQTVIAAWAAFEPDQRYFRLETHSCIAVVDLDSSDGFFFDRGTGEESPLEAGDRHVPPWEKNLERLVDAN